MAVRLNNGGSHYLARTATLPSIDDLSIGAWVYIDTAVDWSVPVGLDDGGSGRFLVELSDTRPQVLSVVYTHNGSWPFNVFTNGTQAAGGWFYVGLWKTAGGVLGGYVGTTPGTLDALAQTFSNDVINITPTGLYVGTSGISGSAPLNGRVAHLRVWSGTVLSEAEFEAESESATAVITANLWAEYQFETGALTTDSSGNSRDLTATGTPTFIADPSGLTEGGGGGSFKAAWVPRLTNSLGTGAR